jgi:hypothetical protein
MPERLEAGRRQAFRERLRRLLGKPRRRPDGRPVLAHRPALPLKPLSDVPARHRKRAALRRGCWQAIERSARLALQRHLAGSAAY